MVRGTYFFHSIVKTKKEVISHYSSYRSVCQKFDTKSLKQSFSFKPHIKVPTHLEALNLLV